MGIIKKIKSRFKLDTQEKRIAWRVFKGSETYREIAKISNWWINAAETYSKDEYLSHFGKRSHEDPLFEEYAKKFSEANRVCKILILTTEKEGLPERAKNTNGLSFSIFVDPERKIVLHVSKGGWRI